LETVETLPEQYVEEEVELAEKTRVAVETWQEVTIVREKCPNQPRDFAVQSDAETYRSEGWSNPRNLGEPEGGTKYTWNYWGHALSNTRWKEACDFKIQHRSV